METTLMETHSSPLWQQADRHLLRPARLILSRPPARSPVKAIWNGLRMSKAWGEALETYGLPQE